MSINITEKEVIAAQEGGYWFVHDPRNRAPKHLHCSEVSAVTEATRLAHCHPGTRYFVLQATRCFIEPKQQVIELEIEYRRTV